MRNRIRSVSPFSSPFSFRFSTGVRACVILGSIVGMVAVGCGGGSSSPTTPTTPTPPTPPPTNPPPPTPPPSAFSVTGRVVSSITGQPVAGARVAPEVGEPVTTAADGTFQFASATNPQFNIYKTEVTADGYVTRNAQLRWERTRTGVEIDLIPLSPPFSLDFFRQLVRDGYERPEDLQVLRRLNASPSIYIRTVDDAGTHDRSADDRAGGIDGAPLGAGMERRRVERRGRGNRHGGAAADDGWIMIEFIDQPDATFCGRANVGAADGWMQFNYNNCGCGGRRIAPSIITHETGHALGFWHVRDRSTIMSPVYDNPCTDDLPTTAEALHARLAYRRGIGNRDPDQDLNNFPLALPGVTGPSPEIICPLR